MVYYRIGDLEKTANDFTQVIRSSKLNPIHTDIYINRGIVFLKTGQPEKARDDFNKALSIDPNLDNAKRLIEYTRVPGAAYIAYDAALGFMGEYVRDAECLTYDNGHYFGPRQEIDMDKAIEHFTEAINLAPDFTLAHNGRGVCYLRKEQFHEAEEDFNEALKAASNDEHKVLLYSNLAVVYHKQDEFDKALDYADKALKINSRSSLALSVRKNIEQTRKVQMAAAYLNQGDYTNAMALYRQVLKDVPDHNDALQNFKLALDRRIAENRNRYPAPFNGSWKYVVMPAQNIPKRRETYDVSEEYYVEVTKTTVRGVPYPSLEKRYRTVKKTIIIPARTTPELSVVWKFNGSTYQKTEVTLTTTKTGTGTFYYDGDRIELDDGTVLRFTNGVINDGTHSFTRQ